MYIICIESSNSRGMGHLFRALLYVDYLSKHKINYMVLINDDVKSLEILNQNRVLYEIVDFQDVWSNWEKNIINKYSPNVWINDKFETSNAMIRHIKETNTLFCLIDDIVDSNIPADLHFAGMIYPSKKDLCGKHIFSGHEYIILNPEINYFRKKREKIHKIIISMGGSDPHGVTLEIAKELLKYSYNADFIIGPNFKQKELLSTIVKGRFKLYQNVPSLIEFFSGYDLAITGGGVTCCEANASGLPCVIISNAPHEINTGKYVESFGGSIYAGHYDNWDRTILNNLNKLNVSQMSLKGMESFSADGVEKIMSIIHRYLLQRRNYI